MEGIEFDDEMPVSVVHVGMWGEGGKPMPTVRSAVCDTCERWATHLWTSRVTVTGGEGDAFQDVRVKRTTVFVVYACADHEDEIGSRLADEYGATSGGAYDPDELAMQVAKFMQQRHNREAYFSPS